MSSGAERGNERAEKKEGGEWKMYKEGRRRREREKKKGEKEEEK